MPKSKKRRRRRLLILIAGLVLIGIGGVIYSIFHKGDQAIPVQTDKVTRRDVTETVISNGKIQPIAQVLISPEVAGEIIDLPVVEGQRVKKGDLLLQIKPDSYQASRNSAEANYKFALGSRSQAEAELEKAEADYKQYEELSKNKLTPASVFLEYKTKYEIARLHLTNSIHQVDQAHFALDKAADDLSKTTITSPIDGTITRLKSQLGERVLGTSFNMGTEVMTIAQLDEMEARVDIGEIDIVLVQPGQVSHIEVDAFKDRKFTGTVTAIANASKGSSMGATSQSMGSSQQQEAPKFEVKIRINEKETFRPGMSVTAEIETRTRTNTLVVPIQCVTTRLPLGKPPAGTPSPNDSRSGSGATPKPGKAAEPIKPIEVVFVPDGNRTKMIPVKTGISDSDYFEILSGLNEGQPVISGGYKAIAKDLEDGKKIVIGTSTPSPEKKETP